MRIAIWLLSLLALSASVSAQTDSFCVKYSKTLFGASTRNTNYQLLNAVVARVTVGCNNDLNQAFGVPGVTGTQFAAYAPQICGDAALTAVTGITKVPGLVQDPLNAPFFAGTAPAFQSFTNAAKLNAFAKAPAPGTTAGITSIPFVQVNATTRVVTPLAATLGGNIAANTVSEGLITHLISFFGIALGCDVNLQQNTVMANPTTTAFIGKYNGVVNMTAVHVGMAINQAVWDEFANTFILTLKSFGVTQPDIDNIIVPYLSTFLRGPQGSNNVICNQPDCKCATGFTLVNGQCIVPPPTFCQKYSKALFGASTKNTNYQLLNAVVARVTVGCNNNLALAFGVPGVTGTQFAAYAPQICGNAATTAATGITSVNGLVQDPLNAPFFAGTAPFFQSQTNAAQLNAFSQKAPIPGVSPGITSIPFVGVNATTRMVTPFAATTGGNIAAGIPSEGLIQHLISFFGIALGCDVNMVQSTMQTPATTAFIGKYNGIVNMTQVHVGMAINFAVWTEFSNTFIMALKSFGVTQADIDQTISPYLATFLRGPAGSNNVICNQADCPCATGLTKTADNQCVVPPPPTFCQKYAMALFKNSTRATHYQLLNAVVARVTVGCNNNLAQAIGVPNVAGTIFAAYGPQTCGMNGVTVVPGLVSDKLNAPFFTGTAPMYKSVTGLGALNTAPNNAAPPPAPVPPAVYPSIRFVGAGATPLQVSPYSATIGTNIAGIFNEGLIQHLISYFGIALGCDVDLAQNTMQAGNSPFIGRYNGVTSMTQVHAGMAIDQNVWDEFVNTFVMTLQSFGVSQADIDGTVKPYLASFLRGPATATNVICNQPNCACAPQFTLDPITNNCVNRPVATPTVLPTPPAPTETFCSKYAAALFPKDIPAVAEYRLLQSVIARVILGCNNNIASAFSVNGATTPDLLAFGASQCGNVTGFAQVNGLVSDPLNAPFFTGAAPPFGSITRALALNQAANIDLNAANPKFVAVTGFKVDAFPASLGGQVPFDKQLGLPVGTTMFEEGLIQHLIAFFGRDLGCKTIDTMHDTVPLPGTTTMPARIGRYNGAPSMFQVHQNMKITKAVWNEFAATFVGALKSFGVTQADIDGTIVPYVSQFLRGPANGADMMICNQPDCDCAPQFQKDAAGQCIDPNAGTNTQTQGGRRIGSANNVWVSPIMILALTVITYLFA